MRRRLITAVFLPAFLLLAACAGGAGANQPTVTVAQAPQASYEDEIAQKAWDDLPARYQLSTCDTYSKQPGIMALDFLFVVDPDEQLYGAAKSRMEGAVARMLAANCA